MNIGRNDHLVSFLLLLSAILVITGTYVQWSSFGPFYTGLMPTSPGHIEEGYQLLDLPILGSALLGCLVVYRFREREISGLIGGFAGILTALFAGFQTLAEAGSIFQLRWGYYLTLLSALLLGAARMLRLWMSDNGDLPPDLPTRNI